MKEGLNLSLLADISSPFDQVILFSFSPDDSRFCAFSIKFSHDNKEILAG